MHRPLALFVLPMAALPLLLAGCGSSPAAAAPKAHAHHHTAKKTKTTTGQATSGSGSGSPTGSSSGTGSQPPAASGPAISYSMMPQGSSGGLAASLGVTNLPTGWHLVSMSLVGPNGLSVTATIPQAMTGSFSAAKGGFSMGADGQIITFFFPTPAGPWKGQPVHFAFGFGTSSGVPETVQSANFTFPGQ